jgi:hypothetical protein
MNAFVAVLVLQLAAPAGARPVAPVLGFPDPTLDDTSAYQGYRTRFFQDFAGNTVQVYTDNRSGRVVNLLADAEDESIGFTVRDQRGQPTALSWGSERAMVWGSPRSRWLVYELEARSPRVAIGWFLLGSMRVERDFQYANRHTNVFTAPRFVLPEMDRLLAALGRLDAVRSRQHLSLLNAADTGTLRARLQPTITAAPRGPLWVASIVQPSLDGRDTLILELRADRARVDASYARDTIALSARSGRTVSFSVAVYTTGKTLHPLTRQQIFSDDFLRFLAEARRDSASRRARWLERQARGVQLVSSRE